VGQESSKANKVTASERSASQIDRVTLRLWRGVGRPRRCLIYPCCSELATTKLSPSSVIGAEVSAALHFGRPACTGVPWKRTTDFLRRSTNQRPRMRLSVKKAANPGGRRGTCSSLHRHPIRMEAPVSILSNLALFGALICSAVAENRSALRACRNQSRRDG
jgi:hypothetical protein